MLKMIDAYENYLNKLKKDRSIVESNKKIETIWDLHWRLRSEENFRKSENRVGGYYKENDTISKLSTEEIGFLMWMCENIRLEANDNSLDT